MLKLFNKWKCLCLEGRGFGVDDGGVVCFVWWRRCRWWLICWLFGGGENKWCIVGCGRCFLATKTGMFITNLKYKIKLQLSLQMQWTRQLKVCSVVEVLISLRCAFMWRWQRNIWWWQWRWKWKQRNLIGWLETENVPEGDCEESTGETHFWGVKEIKNGLLCLASGCC